MAVTLVWSLLWSGAMGRRWRLAVLGVVCAASWSCVDADSGGDAGVGVTTEEINGGKPRDDHPEIARVWLKDPASGKLGFCTATLIDRKIAITAGHCVHLRSEDHKDDYGFLEVIKKEWNPESRIYEMRTYRYQVTGYHNFTLGRYIPGYSTSDIALVRLAQKVPCPVAHPTRMARNPPPLGTVISRWGYGQCDDKETSRKRVIHLRRGKQIVAICSGDSGGPTLDPNGAVFAINHGWKSADDGGYDTVSMVGPQWSRLSEVMDKWGRGGRCD